jgi:outer membrane protein assembly factor BamB
MRLILLFLLSVPVVSITFAADTTQGRAILELANYRGGLIVHIGCGDGRLTAALHTGDEALVQGLDADAAKVAEARKQIRGLGLYGKVSADVFDGRHLPYARNLVNLVVAEDLGEVTMDEVTRVLTPHGVACLKSDGEWKVRVKSRPQDIDDWTHFLHSAAGNAVAADERVGHATALQWIAKPMYCRSHEIDASLPAMVSANGRLFYILDEGPIGITDPRFPGRWMLVARDAFNGILLWKQPLKPWGWQEWKPEIGDADWRTLRGQRGRFPAEVPRRLVAVGDRVYVTLGFHDAPISILDAATGRVLRQCEGTEGTQEIVVDGGTVFAKVQNSPAGQTERRGGKVATKLMALDADTGARRWSQEVGKINPLTLTASIGAVVFLRGSTLRCLDQSDGALRWEADCSPSGIVVIHQAVVLTSGKGGTNAFSLVDGKPLWKGPSTGRDLFVIRNIQHHAG